MKKRIVSILGCGWLGVPLAKHLLEAGFQVKGSVTSLEKIDLLSQAGISPFRVVLSEAEMLVSDPGFFNCDVLIISIPPRRIEAIERIYPAQLAQLIPFILKYGIRKVIFISSTSVYPENRKAAREEDTCEPDKSSGKAIILAENLFKNRNEFETTIIRFGGLIGADRNPARFLLKSSFPVDNNPVNLIHLDDCIGIIASVIDQDMWGEVLNACCPEHPLKKEFYGKAAGISGSPVPVFSEEDKPYKIVDSSKLISLLNYKFRFSSPMDYLESLVNKS